MKYIACKVGTKYVSMDETGNVKLTKNAEFVWPVEMEMEVEEGMDKLRDQGLNVRIVFVETK